MRNFCEIGSVTAEMSQIVQGDRSGCVIEQGAGSVQGDRSGCVIGQGTESSGCVMKVTGSVIGLGAFRLSQKVQKLLLIKI